MAEKLKSVLRTVQLQLAIKTFAFASLLLLVKTSNFGILPILLFLLTSFISYFKNHSHNNSENIYSFLTLLVVALLGIGPLNHLQFVLAAIFYFSLTFYLILGIKDLVFVRRFEWNFVKNIILLFSIFSVYFISGKYDWFVLKYLAIFIAVYFIVKEWLAWLGNIFPKRYQLTALILAFLTLQILWVVSILPLGFINSAALITIFIYLIFDLSLNHFRGTLNRDVIIRSLLVLISSTFIIFSFTNWKI